MRLVVFHTHTVAYIRSCSLFATNHGNPAAAAASTGSTTTGTVVTAAQTTPFSVSSLSISTGMFAALTNDTKFTSLSLAKDNWPKWKQKILQVLGMYI
jgi:hypothetical protein